MKRLLISTLSVLTLSSLAISAFTNKAVAVEGNTSETNRITPFRLVSGSYQGRFKAQGIPSAGALITAVNTNRIDARDLVQGAIASGRLTEATLSDRGYLNSVNSLLENLDSD